MRLELAERDWLIIKGALRMQEESHKKNGFNVLVQEAQELRSRINDAYIDSKAALV